jgi:hypothetical protein
MTSWLISRFLTLRAILFVGCLIAFVATGCDSTDSNEPPASEEETLPENFQDGWVLQFRGAQGADYQYSFTGSGGTAGNGSGNVPNSDAADPYHLSLFGTPSSLDVEVTYVGGGDGEMVVRLYHDAVEKDEVSLNGGEAGTLSGSQ